MAQIGLECQCGFSPLKGCCDALFCLKSALQKQREHQLDSWVLFVDLVKAFDTVNRQALMLILKKFGIPDWLVSLISRLHTDVKVKLKVGEADVTFDATIGVKQGDNMAPVLFLFYIQAAIEKMDRDWPVDRPEFLFKMDSTVTGRPYTAKGARFNFWTSLYADDGGFLFNSRSDLKAGARTVYICLLAFGLKMHVAGKTEALYVPAHRSDYDHADLTKVDVIDVNGTVVGFVPFSEVFRYLGSHIHWSLSDEFDVKHRITSANGAFGALSSTLCDRRVNYALKGKIYCTLVFSILLYGSECWALSQALVQQLQTFHNKCVRKMCRVTLQHCHLHRITAASLDARLGLHGIQPTIDRLRMGWVGHVARMSDGRLPRRFLTAWIRAKRPIGRPRLSTAHCISDTIRRAELNVKDWVHLAQDRNNWSKISSSVHPKVEKRGRRPALQPPPLPPPPPPAQPSLPQRQHRPATRSTTQI